MDNDLADLIMEDYKAGGANHENNKVKYIHQYGIQLEVPGVYIYDSKLNPKNKDQIIQVVRYKVPKDTNEFKYKILTHSLHDECRPDHPKKAATISQIYNDKIYQESNVLRLISTENDKLVVQKQIVIPLAKNPLIVFSPNGDYFCILLKVIGKIIAYNVQNGDMAQLLETVEDGSAKKQVELEKLYNFDKIAWDSNS